MCLLRSIARKYPRMSGLESEKSNRADVGRFANAVAFIGKAEYSLAEMVGNEVLLPFQRTHLRRSGIRVVYVYFTHLREVSFREVFISIRPYLGITLKQATI